MADVTYYVALPFLQDDSGAPVAGAAEECQSSTTALRRAEMMSRMAGSIGAVAFSRTGDPMIGEFGDAKLLRKFGDVPDDLARTLVISASICRDRAQRSACRSLVPPLRLAHIHRAVGLLQRATCFRMGLEDRDTGGRARGNVRPRNTKVRRSIASSSEAALALASVSLRFHNSSANSSPPSRPTTSDARTWPNIAVNDRLQHGSPAA